jgi:hypothetical protein
MTGYHNSWVRAGLIAAAAAALFSCSPAEQDAEAPATNAAGIVADPNAPTPTSADQWVEMEQPETTTDHASRFRTDTVDIRVAPAGDPGGGDKLEFKVQMSEDAPLVYAWNADGGDNFYHEFHGHTGNIVSFYKKAEGDASQGEFTAPFDGIHGWYFENRSSEPVLVRLRMGGFYEIIAD